MAEALYRKYRPRTFAEVVGQDAIERTLKNAVSQDKVSHAYLFCGPRGTGKTTTARLLAKALLCEQGPTPAPDGTCAQCDEIARGVHPDVYELDAASRTGVENVREEIIGRVVYAPTRGRLKVYIIDEVHMLSVAAFNALLKTLEEPPSHVVFVLCTTDPQKVPDTILSRCQRFDFKRISAAGIAGRLAEVCAAEGVEAQPEALDLLATHARGGMRDALTALEASIVHGAGAVTLADVREVIGEGDGVRSAALLEAVAVRDVAACFGWVAEAADAGIDLGAAAAALAADVRDLYVMAVVGGGVGVAPAQRAGATNYGLAAVRAEALRRVSGAFGIDRAARALAVLGDAMADMKNTANPRLTFEIALTRLARPAEDNTLEALAERVEALEAGGAGVVVPLAGGAVASAAVAPAAPMAAAPAVSPTAALVSPAPSPSPATAPAPAVPAAPAAVLSDARVNAAWPSVIAQLKKASPASSALFADAAPRLSAGGVVEVVFPATNGFACRAAQSEAHSTNFAAALARVFGGQVPFALVVDGGGAPVAKAAVAPVTSPTPAPRPAPRPTSATPAAPVANPVPATPVVAPVAKPAPAVTPAPRPASAVAPAPAPAPAAPAPIAEPPAEALDPDASMADFFAGFGATYEEYE